MTILKPAAYVISVFGGIRATARALDRHPSTVSKWQRPVNKRGCGGNVPRGAQRLILEYAQAHGLDIGANDLIYGRKVLTKKRGAA